MELLDSVLLVVGVGQLLTRDTAPWTIVFGYFSPDAIMPLGSALAAIIGIALMFWQRFVSLIRRGSRRLRKAKLDSRSCETSESES